MLLFFDVRVGVRPGLVRVSSRSYISLTMCVGCAGEGV